MSFYDVTHQLLINEASVVSIISPFVVVGKVRIDNDCRHSKGRSCPFGRPVRRAPVSCFTPTPLFCASDLRDDLQHCAVLWDPQQPGLLEVQTAVQAAAKDGPAAALGPLRSCFLQQEPPLLLLAGCSHLFEKMM